MTPPPFRLSALLLGSSLRAPVAPAEVMFDAAIPHLSRETFDLAMLHFWLPDNAGPVHGARWGMAVEPKYGHNTANANDLALPFFEAVMRSWDRPSAGRAGSVLDLDHWQIIPPGVSTKAAGMTFWFPDEPTMAVWNHFMTTPR